MLLVLLSCCLESGGCGSPLGKQRGDSPTPTPHHLPGASEERQAQSAQLHAALIQPKELWGGEETGDRLVVVEVMVMGVGGGGFQREGFCAWQELVGSCCTPSSRSLINSTSEIALEVGVKHRS